MNRPTCKVAFLDRDGTINVDEGYVHRIDEWRFLDGAVDAVVMLGNAGFRVAVITNQSGIAAGRYSMADVSQLHSYMLARMAEEGAIVDAIAVCPHGATDNCTCRKPQTAMADRIARQLDATIDYAHSWTIGDKLSDIQFGAALGMRTALIRSRYWTEADLDLPPTLVVSSLLDAAIAIVGESQQPSDSSPRVPEDD